MNKNKSCLLAPEDHVREHILCKRGLYWRPDSKGYTGLLSEAGRYSLAFAKEAERDGMTVIILESDASQFSPCCCQDIIIETYEKEIKTLRAEWDKRECFIRNLADQTSTEDEDPCGCEYTCAFFSVVHDARTLLRKK